jgi:hypothetical protein
MTTASFRFSILSKGFMMRADQVNGFTGFRGSRVRRVNISRGFQDPRSRAKVLSSTKVRQGVFHAGDCECQGILQAQAKNGAVRMGVERAVTGAGACRLHFEPDHSHASANKYFSFFTPLLLVSGRGVALAWVKGRQANLFACGALKPPPPPPRCSATPLPASTPHLHPRRTQCRRTKRTSGS